LGWPHAPFEIPEAVHLAWGRVARRGSDAHRAWRSVLATSPHRAAFVAQQARDPAPLAGAMAAHKAQLLADRPKIATRKASELALNVVNVALPFTIGGSADLTGSNLTRSKGQKSVTRDDFSGSYIHYGIREHGMAAAMNGIALYGLFRPYGGTFMAFADYSRPAIRLGALMGVPVVHVMTHDSIGLGEDGPTHQPVEHLAMLRATPNLHVFRPADTVETAEAWEIALTAKTTPSVLALSRQNLPTVRRAHTARNLTAQGAYVRAEGRVTAFTCFAPQLSGLVRAQWRALGIELLRGVRYPSLWERYWVGYGRPDLPPERSLQAQVFVQASREGWGWYGAAFVAQTRNRIVTVPLSPVRWQAYSLGYVESWGVEGRLSYTAPRWQGW
ncbi:MAG: TonB-dependent receptor domain-containing protein, partial [Gemmobacter sp.]